MTDESIGDDYGVKLYENTDLFEKLFPDFENKQRASASLLWKRILSRGGKDPEIPRITRVIDLGCGEGTFLRMLAEESKSPQITFEGLDCSVAAINKANENKSEEIIFSSCSPNPKEALEGLDVDWKTTALLVMGHTWFHLDQKPLIAAILKLRPALIAVDVYSSWDTVIKELGKSRTGVNESHYEHGRICDGDTYWLRTQPLENNQVRRGVWKAGDRPENWIFQTTQSSMTTAEVFGTRTWIGDEAEATILKESRSSGMLVHCSENHSDEKLLGYVRIRNISHPTAWGPMDMHVLVRMDPLSNCLNESYFTTVEGMINEVVNDSDSAHSQNIKNLLSIFDDYDGKESKTPEANAIVSGSREAIVIQPFDPSLTFAKVVPMFNGQNLEISKHPMLVENPSRSQVQFPSAYGIYQTCLARSSSAQAFPTDWALDYHLTKVDLAFGTLENAVLGLNKDGKWKDECDVPSYFMVPFYFGSLPLFCLALKFPKIFCPSATAFDVFYSSIKSLHDSIMVSLDSDTIRMRIIRPWIDQVLGTLTASRFWREETQSKLEDKLNELEEYLFGVPCCCNGELPKEHKWELDGKERCGGALGKPWKSWVLGLPSHPIHLMTSVKVQNFRLYKLWTEEKRIALQDPCLRISLWFQDGKFFEDVPGSQPGHDYWDCAHHLEQLREMFCILGFQGEMNTGTNDSWINAAVDFLQKSDESRRYFGENTVNHFSFKWLLEQLNGLPNAKTTCSSKSDCQPSESEVPKCPRNQNQFTKLKAVFCKTRANKGKGVRFTSLRIYLLLQAACKNVRIYVYGKDTEPEIWPKKNGFYSDKDPSMVLAELAHSLKCQKLLESINISSEGDLNKKNFRVQLNLNKQLSPHVGGNECEIACDLLETYKDIEHYGAYCPASLFDETALKFDFTVDKKNGSINPSKTNT